ncbi:hypothetical protein [Caulobacter sp.]|uniref:hypothetical protein n=1 Tax=Caulobacter sp. TaxID=78 RepID=UPI003BAB36F4
MKACAIALALIAMAAPTAFAQTAPAIGSSAEMSRLYEADQADRKSLFTADWAVVRKNDSERRARTKALLDAGALHSAEDYRQAAFVFQHGDAADDYLMAHTLAMIAVEKGDASALWIASASLDRFLHAIGRPQIYGTQYALPADKPEVTQEPYDRSLISDAIRRDLGVPDMAQQRQRMLDYLAEQKLSKKP